MLNFLFFIKIFVLAPIRENPNVTFSLVLPTYSRLYYKLELIDNDEVFSHWSKIFVWFVSEIDKLPNARIYGFDDLPYANDIASYKDLTHYDTNMNDMQLQAIADQKHIITSDNVASYLKIMREKILSYDLEQFFSKLKGYNKHQ